MKRKALGRGLSALLSDASEMIEEKKVIREIPIFAIETNHLQPRSDFDETGLQELADSIRRQGILQPLLVRPHPHNDEKYQIIAGERRLRAAKLASLDTVPCIELEAEEAQMLEIALVENIQRSALNPVDEAKAFKHLIERFALTQEEVSVRVGKSREAVANSLRLLQLPSAVLSALMKGEISVGHAKVLLVVKNHEKLESIAEQIIKNGLSVRATEDWVHKQDFPDETVPKKPPEKDIHIIELEKTLEESFQTKVRIRMRGKMKGTIEVHFFDLDQMDFLLKKWNVHLSNI